MKHLYAVLFILACLSVKSQNWQTVYSDRLVFFDSSRQAIKIVSVSVDSTGDSTFKNYPQYYIDSLGDDITRFLAFKVKPTDSSSWIGRKVIIKPNGYNGFCSDKDDWLWINTRAGINDTFIFHEDNNVLIRAFCTEKFLADTFGIKDSVKRFSFKFSVKQGYGYKFDTVALQNFEVMLSKHYGLLKAPVFNKISLLKGIYMPGITYNYFYKNYFTNYNFNNLEIGNEYEYIVSDLPIYGVVEEESRSYYQVVDKKQIATTDTFQYTFLFKYRRLRRDKSDPKRFWVYHKVEYTEQKRLQNESQYNGLLPGQLINSFAASQSYFSDTCNLLISVEYHGFESGGRDDYHSKIGMLRRFEDGSVYGGHIPVGKEYQIYYKNFCNTQYGTPWAKYYVYGVGVDEIETAGHLSVYPNPANDKVSINVTGLQSVALYNINGKQLAIEFTIDKNQAILDVVALSDGVYFVVVETTEGISTQKLMVRH